MKKKIAGRGYGAGAPRTQNFPSFAGLGYKTLRLGLERMQDFTPSLDMKGYKFKAKVHVKRIRSIKLAFGCFSFAGKYSSRLS